MLRQTNSAVNGSHLDLDAHAAELFEAILRAGWRKDLGRLRSLATSLHAHGYAVEPCGPGLRIVPARRRS